MSDHRFSAHGMPCLPAQREPLRRLLPLPRRGVQRDNAAPAVYTRHPTLQTKPATNDYVFHQTDGTPWKSILEAFRSLLHAV
jgi:hypothetical protein